MMGSHESERSIEIPTEILHDILLRLPTKDVARSSCVSKLWRSIIGDPSFRKLHDADYVAARSQPEVLFVSVNQEPGRHDEASVVSLPSGKAMCRVDIPGRYSLANVCNGFLCFALDYDQAPPVLCIPVTGETLELPEAPPISEECLFVLGFSPKTTEYKMFRLSSSSHTRKHRRVRIYVSVYTLGGSAGWRQHSYLSEFRPSRRLPPPMYMCGNVYVPVEKVSSGERAARMLVLDVTTEAHRMYRLPYNYGEGYHPAWEEMLADGFEMNGRMCLAVNVIYPRRKLQFWVMAPPGELEDKDDGKLCWDMRYCFDLGDDHFYFNTPRAAWLDEDKMLCYRHAESLYKHDTRGFSSSSNDGSLLFQQKVELPKASSLASSYCYSYSPSYNWNIYGGYRPSLLSPLTFAVPPCQDEKGKKARQFEHTLLCALIQSQCCISEPQVGQH
ncbi:unnamed protein product [Urochloa humidicola]